MIQLLETEGATRYRLLETMRHYGAEHLHAADATEELARRHSAYYATFAERAALGLRGREEVSWARALDADFDNLRVAVSWTLGHTETDLALRLISGLWTYPIDRMILEPAEWAETALRNLPNLDTHPLTARAHITAGYGAQQSGRYNDTLTHAQAAIAIAEERSPLDLPLALGLAISGAIFLGEMGLATRYLYLIMAAARLTRDDYTISRALWFPLTAHRIVPTDLDTRAAAAECLALAEQVGSPTLLARAHIVNGIVLGGNEPSAASEHFATCERYGRLIDSAYYIAMGVAFGAVSRSMLDPTAGLKELLRALDWHQRTATPMGITRGLFRDLLPALSQLGLHHLVAVLDAHLPPVAMLQPDEANAAVRRAHEVLGPAGTEHARTEGHTLDATNAVALLRREVENALGATNPQREPV